MPEKTTVFIGTGRRKTAVARVRIGEGNGKIQINGKECTEYFGGVGALEIMIKKPLEVVNAARKYDVIVRVNGGGLQGQAGAVRHGIARALVELNDTWRLPLKQAGYLTRDPRMKERKKYGQKGARKRFQFSKR
ncbi:MAG: 30S ribosomal protein S9 [Candidatus Theseobacter exili]|nr:30S ribosomal protein S9 [Candidatus Theseobacter exili]